MSKKKSGMQIYTKQDKAILYCGYALLAVFSSPLLCRWFTL